MENYYNKQIYPSSYKIIVIGDLHGDLNATIDVLKKSKLINKKLNWVGGKTQVIQMGDIFDRKSRTNEYSDEDSELKIFGLLVKLKKQAYESGGGFHLIMGNHELMNVNGNFSYVSQKGFDHFKKNGGRRKHFQPGSLISKAIAQNMNVVIKMGKFLFVHASCSPEILRKYNIKYLNNMMKSYLNGNKQLIHTKQFHECFLDNNSILWNRNYSMGSNFNPVPLRKELNKLKCDYMVVGHSIQDNINCKNNLVWCVDVGMSKAFGVNNKNKIQSLEIIRNGKKFNILN